MQRIARNAGRALRLDRDLYSSLIYDGSATADAVLIVLVIGAIPPLLGAALGRIPLVALPSVAFAQVIGYIVGWLVAAGLVYLLSTKVFGGFGTWQSGLALTGYAYVPLLLFAALGPILTNPFDGSSDMIELLLQLGGMLWFGAGLTRVADVAYEVSSERRIMVAALAVLGWWVITLVLL